MVNDISCFGALCLQQGSWAEWVSGAASFGAVVAAVAGFYVTKHFRDEDLTARTEERTRFELAADVQLANLIGVRLFRLMNSSHDLHRHLWAPYDGPPIEGVDSEKVWRRVLPMIGLQIEPALRLESDEVTFLVRLSEAEFMTEMILGAARLDSIVLSLQEYERQHQAIYKMMPAPLAMQGRVGVHGLTHEQLMAVKPYSEALEHLVLSLREMTQENVEKLDALCREFHPMMKRHYPSEKFLALIPPESRAGVEPKER